MVRRIATYAAVAAITLQYLVPLTAAGHRLPDGTRIPVRVVEQLSSGTLKDNDIVNFAVVEDVIVDGAVVIKQGTPVRGTIVDAQAKRRMGRAGKLQYTVNETKAVDRSVIRLRAVQQKQGDSNVTSTAVTTAAVAVFVPVAAPFFLLRKGHDIVVPEGTRIDAFVDGDHAVAALSEPAPGTDAVVAARTAAAGGGRLTNMDVLALHQAGFGQELLLAKIASSSPAFEVAPADLLELKKAGVPEPVIAAMLSAR